MKNLLLAGVALVAFASSSAMAADMAVKAPLVPPYDWTGCYIGGQVGGTWGLSQHTALSGEYAGYDVTPSFPTSGAVGGGTVGCNYQVGPWVYGVEGDFSWTDSKGTTPDLDPNLVGGIQQLLPIHSETTETWIGTARARLGYAWDAPKDGTAGIIYVTGGLASADIGINVCNDVIVPSACASASQTRTGWTVGGGLEVPIYNSPWTFKFDYLYLDFGTSQFFNPPPAFDYTRNVKVTQEIVRVGLNYRFTWGPPPPPVRY